MKMTGVTLQVESREEAVRLSEEIQRLGIPKSCITEQPTGDGCFVEIDICSQLKNYSFTPIANSSTLLRARRK